MKARRHVRGAVRFTRRFGPTLLLVAAACGGTTAKGPGGAPRSAAAATLAITHVAVWDGRADVARPDRTVLVRGNRIVAEGPAADLPVPAGARVLDGVGRWLVPGLWDMHVHTVTPGGGDALALYVANGVTGVRDMAGDLDSLRAWGAEIAAHRRIGPRMVVSGPYLEGGDVPIPHLLVATPDDAAPAVDSLVRLGVDFVKVHSQLDRERYFAIARAARARGIAFAGHVPRAVLAVEASDSGQRSIEHLLTIPNACTPADSARLVPRYPVQGALGRCSAEDLEPIFRRFAANHTWVTPTISAQVEVARWPLRDLPGDAYAPWLTAAMRDFVAEIFPMPDDVPPGADSVGLALLAKRVEIVGALHRAGVHLLVGTDAPLRNSPPGFGLHGELAWMVRAGLTPAEALRAATLEPARYLEAEDSLGTIRPGMLADLVLLDADPLADIANTRRIVAVVADGVVHEPGPILARARAAAPTGGRR